MFRIQGIDLTASAVRTVKATGNMAGLRHRYVKTIYGDHNRAISVRRALSRCIATVPADGTILNVGAGHVRIDPRAVNLDLVDGPEVDKIGDAQDLPFAAGTFDLVISQECLEHVRDPFQAAREMRRVLRPGGRAYIQVPFIIGYHPGPTDFWRFTREGVQELVEQAGFEVEEVGVSVGTATGMYRVAVEFVASSVASVLPPAYIPAKGLASLVLYPLKALDRLLWSQPDRIAGGYFAVARAPHEGKDETRSIHLGAGHPARTT